MRRTLIGIATVAALGCQHASPAAGPKPSPGAVTKDLPPVPEAVSAHSSAVAEAGQGTDPAEEAGAVAADARAASTQARAIADEAHALIKAEGELFWRRWTTGQGPLPSTAAAGRGHLWTKASMGAVASAAATAESPRDALALRLLHGHLATRAIARAAATEAEALEHARARLSFTPRGGEKAEHERDLDRLLLDEPSATARARLAIAEAKAAAELLPLVVARDAAFEKAREDLGLPSWAELIEELHRAPPEQLAALAERALLDTEDLAARAVAESALRNLGLPADRVHRADLPRLLRVTSADPEFQPGQAWTTARKLLSGLGAPLPAFDKIVLDAEPRPGKGARPLALLVDPPRDVRLSYRGVGGLDEQRAMLHEAARALGGVTADPEAPWQLAQLGDGAGAEGVARLIEELAGDPAWLRATTRLRGEPLDDLVHAQATRRLLAVRRAAALVLFEVRRREGAKSPEEVATLYRGLLQRATFALYTDEDARRWPLEADAWIHGAATLQGELLSAQLAIVLRRGAGDRSGAAAVLDHPRPDADEWEDDADGDAAAAAGATSSAPVPAPSAAAATPVVPAVEWWRSPKAGAILRQVWSLGRSASSADVLRALRLSSLDPYLLAAIAEEQLGYRAPERPPAPSKPDYKELRGDRKPRKKRKKRAR